MAIRGYWPPSTETVTTLLASGWIVSLGGFVAGSAVAGGDPVAGLAVEGLLGFGLALTGAVLLRTTVALVRREGTWEWSPVSMAVAASRGVQTVVALGVVLVLSVGVWLLVQGPGGRGAGGVLVGLLVLLVGLGGVLSGAVLLEALLHRWRERHSTGG
ncbi:MAG: hypothetical protein ABEJ76_07480 [Halanaeroarchaeum sp.]